MNWYGSSLIDPLMRGLIFDLNKAGYETAFCCQGRTELFQFDLPEGDERKHSARAYIVFDQVIPSRIRARLKNHLFYGHPSHPDDRCIFSMPYQVIEVYSKKDRLVRIEANRTFEAKVRAAFRL